mmetsp:Transcript_65106/g.149090  ORF Transcript_65106/g.149090 Transcript_65106/m.149090 type:complete len:438 (-) Transcript_65106:2433-3746(-)
MIALQHHKPRIQLLAPLRRPPSEAEILDEEVEAPPRPKARGFVHPVVPEVLKLGVHHAVDEEPHASALLAVEALEGVLPLAHPHAREHAGVEDQVQQLILPSALDRLREAREHCAEVERVLECGEAGRRGATRAGPALGPDRAKRNNVLRATHERDVHHLPAQPVRALDAERPVLPCDPHVDRERRVGLVYRCVLDAHLVPRELRVPEGERKHPRVVLQIFTVPLPERLRSLPRVAVPDIQRQPHAQMVRSKPQPHRVLHALALQQHVEERGANVAEPERRRAQLQPHARQGHYHRVVRRELERGRSRGNRKRRDPQRAWLELGRLYVGESGAVLHDRSPVETVREHLLELAEVGAFLPPPLLLLEQGIHASLDTLGALVACRRDPLLEVGRLRAKLCQPRVRCVGRPFLVGDLPAEYAADDEGRKVEHKAHHRGVP